MKILWFTWKDRKHPLAGGAETVNEELAKRLAADGHEVIFLVGGFVGGPTEETINGYKIVRLGGRLSVYYEAYRYYKNNLVGWADLVIDEVNTIPFFCKLYVKEKNILFVHQLCREIWFYQLFFPFSLIGYLLEPLYLLLLNDCRVITVSESSKKDLLRHGFKTENIQIISEGIELEPVSDLSLIKKYEKPTLLSLGSIRAMKRTEHILRAFELAKKEIGGLQFIVAGEATSAYGRSFLREIARSPYKEDIHYLGLVDKEKKIEILQRSHLLAVTSVKEGWCLVVTEANSQGTPAVVYDVDGLRDSVKDGETGVACQENEETVLAKNIISILEDKARYEEMRERAHGEAKRVSFLKSYQEFIGITSQTWNR